MTTINIYGKPERTFRGNQYISRGFRTFKLIVVGTWIAVKEMYHNPGKVALAVLVLGSALNTFMEVTPTHPAVLIVQEAWADLTTADNVYQAATSTVITIKDPVKVLEVVAQCESGGKQFHKDGTLVFGINKNGTIDAGYYQINTANEALARSKGWDIYTYEGNREMALYLYEKNGLRDWYSSKHCWINKI